MGQREPIKDKLSDKLEAYRLALGMEISDRCRSLRAVFSKANFSRGLEKVQNIASADQDKADAINQIIQAIKTADFQGIDDLSSIQAPHTRRANMESAVLALQEPRKQPIDLVNEYGRGIGRVRGATIVPVTNGKGVIGAFALYSEKGKSGFQIAYTKGPARGAYRPYAAIIASRQAPETYMADNYESVKKTLLIAQALRLGVERHDIDENLLYSPHVSLGVKRHRTSELV